jgi:hypothetical protein
MQTSRVLFRKLKYKDIVIQSYNVACYFIWAKERRVDLGLYRVFENSLLRTESNTSKIA